MSMVCILSFNVLSNANNPLLNHMCLKVMLICIMSYNCKTIQAVYGLYSFV